MKMDHIFQKRAPILIQVEIYFWVFRSGLGLDTMGSKWGQIEGELPGDCGLKLKFR